MTEIQKLIKEIFPEEELKIEEKLLTRKQVAKHLGIYTTTIDSWTTRKNYILPMVKVGGAVRYKIIDLILFIKNSNFIKKQSKLSTQEEVEELKIQKIREIIEIYQPKDKKEEKLLLSKKKAIEDRICELSTELTDILNLACETEEIINHSINKNLNKKIEELDFSIRVKKCLKMDNIIYVHQLVQETEASLLRTPNFGRKSLKEVKQFFAENSLKFDMDISSFETLKKDYLKDVTTPSILLENLIAQLYYRNLKIAELSEENYKFCQKEDKQFKLEAEIEKLEEKHNHYYKSSQKEIFEQQTKILSLERNIESLKEACSSLSVEKLQLQTSNTALNTEIEHLQKENQKLSKKLSLFEVQQNSNSIFNIFKKGKN